MQRRKFITGLAATAGLILTAVPEVHALSWTYLGTRRVNLLLDRDRIHVGVSSGLYEKIRLKVRGNGLFVLDVKVVYSNGASDHIPVRFFIPQGGYTRAMDLRGGSRHIRYVQLTYTKPINGNGRTWVDLWGRS